MYKLNLELTKEIYNDTWIKQMIKFKECYHNNFQVCNFSSLRSKFETGEYKVTLCYVDIGLGVWIRHCVIVTDNNEIIDLTLVTNTAFNAESTRNYDIVKIFDFEEYNNLIEQTYDEDKDNYRCDFPNMEVEYNFYKSRKNKDIFYQVNEYDFYEYIFPLLNKYEKIL